jgi:hypothetical protein
MTNKLIARKLRFHTELLVKLLAKRRDYSCVAIRRQIAALRFYRSL